MKKYFFYCEEIGLTYQGEITHDEMLVRLQRYVKASPKRRYIALVSVAEATAVQPEPLVTIKEFE